MTDKPELKPCAFCRGIPFIRAEVDDYIRLEMLNKIICKSCKIQTAWSNNEAYLIRTWNTRE